MSRKIVATLAATALTAFASPAFAALTATGVACDGQSTTMTSLTGYMDCSGAWSGNNSNQSADVAAQILADWGLAGLAGLVSTDVTGGNSGGTGTLNFAAQTGVFVLALKAGDAFSLYELDGSGVVGGISSISYDTLGVGFFSGPNNNMHFGQDLSHADIYTTPVPEPETWALMFGGLGVLAFLGRRQKR
jgi:hypothetical protein